MKKLLIKWFSKPLMPILTQVFIVLRAVETQLNVLIQFVSEMGVPAGTPILDNIKTIITAVIAVKAAVQKVIEFLGGEVPVESQSDEVHLKEELEKLKGMI